MKRSLPSVHALWTWSLLVTWALWPITAQGSATSQPASAPTRQEQSSPADFAANLLSVGIEKALAGQFDQSLALVRQAAKGAPANSRANSARGLLEGYLSSQVAAEKQRAEELSAAVKRVGWYCMAQDHQEQRTAEARSLGDILDAYRRAAKDVASAAARPAAAARDRALYDALDFMRQHYTERLTLAQVARRAGVSRTYFSRLFRERQHTTFQDYIARLRLERARQLLASTELSLGRVAELSGHGTAQYLCRVFRRATRTTPLAYRRSVDNR